MDLSAVGMVLTVAFAAAFDVGTRRIPNFITVGGLAVALVLRLTTGGVDGVLAIAVSFRRKRLGSSLSGTVTVVRGLALKAISGGEVDAVPTLETRDAVTVPYGVAIAVGAVIGLLW